MIQDIYPHKLNNHFDPEVHAGNEDILLCITEGKILVQECRFEDNEIVFPRVKDVSEIVFPGVKDVNKVAFPKVKDDADSCMKSEGEKLRYLFSIDETKYFLLDTMLESGEIPAGYAYVDERSLRKEGIGPDDHLFAAITGKHLADWYRDTRFCGRCGHRMIHSKKERAMVCEACHYTAYPRIMPAVIVGVTNGDKLLITRYRTGFRYNALVAGFTEIGETMEETVQREVMEEAGVRVKNIRYYKSQPWGSANDILLGLYCDVDGDDRIYMDSEELKYAEWVHRKDIVLQPGEFSLTNEMMKRFKEGKEI